MAERQVVLGTLAMASVNVARVGLQLLIVPVLARLLDPSSFGLVALAMPFILFPGMISDLGLGNALVRASDSSRELESTVFWLGMMTAVALAALIVIAAWPVGLLLSEPRLPPIILTLAFVLPLCASLTVANARISRERRFDVFAKGEILACLIAAIAAIGAAFAGMGVWSLVIQQFVLWIVKVNYLMPRSGFQLRFFCRPWLVWPHLKFGVNAAGSNLLDFATKTLPSMVIGTILGVTSLGHYSLAYQVIRVPDMIVSGPMYLPVFTTVARNDRLKRAHGPFVLRGLRGLVTVLAPSFLVVALAADSIVHILFGPKWGDAGQILMMLAPSGFFLCLYSFIGAVLMGLGRSGQQVSLLLLLCVLILIGTGVGTFFGAEGAALGLSVGAALAWPAYVGAVCRQISIPRRLIWTEVAPPVIAVSVTGGILVLVVTEISAWNPWLKLFSVTVADFSTFVLVLAAISWRRLQDDVQWVLSLWGAQVSEAQEIQQTHTGAA
jgi:O-antigen/teichoic acid export membrane protein